MKDFLVVIDMQNDFIGGVLGSPEAQAILPAVQTKIAEHQGPVLFTRDTHNAAYLETQEGKNLPILHCQEGTPGWEIHQSLAPYVTQVIDKPAFGTLALPNAILPGVPDKITLIGLCTDICVILQAMVLKAAFPETLIEVDSACCAGITPEGHQRALCAMETCQIRIV